MAKAYRMPTVPVKPGDKGFPTIPISTMPPRSWVTGRAGGTVRGIAMGGDAGVAKVELLTGSGVVAATLGPDQGKYGFRRWAARLPQGTKSLGVRCTNANGVAQPDVQAWNPSGYARNVIERTTLA